MSKRRSVPALVANYRKAGHSKTKFEILREEDEHWAVGDCDLFDDRQCATCGVSNPSDCPLRTIK